MQLVEKHVIKKAHPLFKEIDKLCFLSKNLYNRANYIIRQEFIKTSKEKENNKIQKAVWLRYKKIQKQLQDDKDFDYKQLPAKVSQQILITLDRNWKSFFASIQDWKKNPQKYKGRPALPRYKHKTTGRNLLIYTFQAISRPQLRQGLLCLSGTGIKISTFQKSIKQARIVPKIGCYIIEIVYEKEVKNLGLDKNKIAGLDIGLTNLGAVTSNQRGFKPILINGRPLKKINQYFNKEKARLQSFVGDRSSNRLRKLTHKRNMKIDNYLHNASKYLVEYLIKNGIGTLVIGRNKFWKTGIEFGKRGNQNFVCVPFFKFIRMIEYKCKLVGIEVIFTEEGYTSKCSFIDFEELGHHESYVGKRIHRGLFVSKEGLRVNADCNGSGNIIRKVFPDVFTEGIEGVVVRPVRVTPYRLVA